MLGVGYALCGWFKENKSLGIIEWQGVWSTGWMGTGKPECKNLRMYG